MSEDESIWETLFDRADEDGREKSLLNRISTVENRYETLEVAGAGAMKRVFRTNDRVSDRLIARAVLKDPENDQAVESFLREARIIATLQHPNIVPLYDMGVDDSGQPFFTMRLLDGLTLTNILNELNKGNAEFIEKYTLSKRIDVFLKICDAMAYAHSEGVAHLDLKPDNIAVSQYGKTLVCDWGIAAIIGSEDKFETSLLESFDYYSKRYYTLSGEIKGTPGYMSPEQAKGAEEVKDERSDIFALGCIFYELLCFEKALAGDGLASIIAMTISGAVDPPVKRRPDLFVPESLSAICMKAMRKDPDRRYQKVEEIIADIDAYRQGFLTEAEDFSFKKQFYLLYKRNRQICHVALGFIIIIILGSFYFVDSLKKEKEATDQALEHSENLRAQNQKISVEASENYALKARTAYYRFQMLPATDLCEAALALDSNNELAISYLAKILLIQQKYKESYEKSLSYMSLQQPKRREFKEKDLREYTQKMLSYHESEHQDIKRIYPNVQEFLKIEDRFVLIAQLYAWAIMEKQSFVDDKLKEIEADISWLLSHENGKEVKCKLSSEVGGFLLDLSGNGDLADIRSIGQLPIVKLDLRGTRVKHMSFVKPDAINLFGLDSFRKTKILWVDKEQEIAPDTFRNATVHYH
ncbi:probable serine/threonine-protein kinase pknB [Lentisphaera araneosa HTCC2155]|uniref:Probable serine/threonine-protein kinase pknB n=1 Tax=Lentisphaera araneosa HTCC2155 TaxID=313628 RepID=A6DMR6_9BACT|nr:serine/threonine-protein kinase [Lentisphaera araneosa]EDM26952.1 probable serine/threonine-protein kinase pknB [Lentisphaera araneosa HTCC2155]